MDKYAIDVRNESAISLTDGELEIIWLRCVRTHPQFTRIILRRHQREQLVSG